MCVYVDVGECVDVDVGESGRRRRKNKNIIQPPKKYDMPPHVNPFKEKPRDTLWI